jgi:dTMP kinase
MNDFVVFEGLDGCGKSTQIQLLGAYLKRQGLSYEHIHFPRVSESIFGRLIAAFLRGEFGDLSEVPPILAALLYAGDRAAANELVRQWRRRGTYVIADRYVYSNMAFQGAKIGDPVEKEKLRRWIEELEFGYFGLEKPSLSLYLHVPFEFIAEQLQRKRVGHDRHYLQGKEDIHESSLFLQTRVEDEYLSLCKDRDDLVLVPCAEEGRILPPSEIHQRILKLLSL